jgi:hypothetical protein
MTRSSEPCSSISRQSSAAHFMYRAHSTSMRRIRAHSTSMRHGPSSQNMMFISNRRNKYCACAAPRWCARCRAFDSGRSMLISCRKHARSQQTYQASTTSSRTDGYAIAFGKAPFPSRPGHRQCCLAGLVSLCDEIHRTHKTGLMPRCKLVERQSIRRQLFAHMCGKMSGERAVVYPVTPNRLV